MSVSATESSGLPRARDLRRLIPSQYASSAGRILRWAIIDWLIILSAWYAMARIDSIAITILGTIVVASRLHALGALLHDACHLQGRGMAWRIVEALAGWPIASTIVAMRYHHIRHHRHSGTALDPYQHRWIQRGPLFRTVLILRGALLPIWWTLRAVVALVAWQVPGLRTRYARAFLQDRSGSDLSNDREVRECIYADMAQLGVQALVLTGAILTDLPITRFYFLPWAFAGILNARRVLVEHEFGEAMDSDRLTVFRNTINHDAGRILNAVFFPHNIGLHRTHHLYPTASFVHLPRITLALRKVPFGKN